MTLVLNLILPSQILLHSSSSRSLPTTSSRQNEKNQDWTALLFKLRCCNRFSCLFSDNRKEVLKFPGKALEGALGGKKSEFEKWDKEIKRREEVGGGGSAGGGDGLGGVDGFGWWNGDHFWREAQQASLAVLVSHNCKGELMLAIIFNPLLYALRGQKKCVRFHNF
ncbi:hypothetical protein GBA52_022117 [Prunus armeniaca]|nr:hypothetical protein GBA52_022117 [Prunus armeniaca]